MQSYLDDLRVSGFSIQHSALCETISYAALPKLQKYIFRYHSCHIMYSKVFKTGFQAVALQR